MMKKRRPNRAATSNYLPLKIVLIVAAAIIVTELFIMFVLVAFSGISALNTPFIDAALLLVFLSPVLYWFVYRPLAVQLAKEKRNEELLQTLALFDELTGLYNRRGFLSFATQLLKLSDRSQRGLVLIFADLNNMKLINDNFGHAEGDKALTCVANVLKNTFRGSDLVGRIGGDEFAVLALEAKQENMDVLRKRLHDNTTRAECNQAFKCSISLSLGLVYYNPEQPCPIEELLHRGDLLMYEEKRVLQKQAPPASQKGTA
jgi:diguanylate cyclase (GGDEF)-like protein